MTRFRPQLESLDERALMDAAPVVQPPEPGGLPIPTFQLLGLDPNGLPVYAPPADVTVAAAVSAVGGAVGSSVP